ncbi:hypothetical protein SCP_1700050 [Sparassis crispa]|uniref:dolichyl-diphosphooligosaccharide--protein glycotransferase n=1 Tax=Sparassis crispa TaxID=139825 RepID=A0A401H5L1_9APHY|nr:hypothetical protein SCP_1700050 [Sparassis crispa]GBE89681.1 hypothetical protein SCP_1700050 [Sparassis crispa]
MLISYSVVVIASATVLQRLLPAPSSRSPDPDAGPRHLPAPSPDPPRPAEARRWLASPPSTIRRPLDLQRPSAASDSTAVLTPAAAIQRPRRPPFSRSPSPDVLCFRELRDEHVFVIIYAVVASYFVCVMVRLILTLTPVVCVASAIAIFLVIGHIH